MRTCAFKQNAFLFRDVVLRGGRTSAKYPLWTLSSWHIIRKIKLRVPKRILP